jgi:hypothetical protein
MNTDMSRAPMLTVSVGRSGLKSQGRPRWLASKRTTMVLLTACTVAACASLTRIVVPPKPVTWQKMR